MKNFIKITDQDGLIYFDQFEENELYVYKNQNNTLTFNIDIRSIMRWQMQDRIPQLEKDLGEKLNEDIRFVYVELRDFETKITSLNEITDLEIKIPKGYEIDPQMDSIACVYFGWDIELNNNIIQFTKDNQNLIVNWKASSDDVNYYDERAKDSGFQTQCALNIKEFNSREEYYQFIRDKNSNN
jgi:hypothetical protein